MFQPIRQQQAIKGAWTKPGPGTMKFNVDGSIVLLTSDAGIGGILRDNLGRTKVVFSMSVGAMEPNFAEYMAIYEAVCIFAESTWCNTGVNLIVETDSATACEWASDPVKIHWRLVDKARNLERLKSKIKQWRIVKIGRELNGTADALAKAGVRRASKLLAFL